MVALCIPGPVKLSLWYDPDQNPLTSGLDAVVTGSTEPISPAALKPQVHPQRHTSEPSVLLSRKHKHRQTLTHLNTLILSRDRCEFAKRAVFLRPPTAFCFTGHTGSSLSLVIELVGWRLHSLLPLLESLSCRLPTDQNVDKLNEWHPNILTKQKHVIIETKWKCSEFKNLVRFDFFSPSKMFNSTAFALKHCFLLIRKVIGALLLNKVP